LEKGNRAIRLLETARMKDASGKVLGDEGGGSGNQEKAKGGKPLTLRMDRGKLIYSD